MAAKQGQCYNGPSRARILAPGRTAVAQHSRRQQKIIHDYYENQEAIALQKLAEHVTELFLAEGKARQTRWKHIVAQLVNLKVPQSRIDHLVAKDDAALLARLVEELMAKKPKA
jgi:hypothetical protein